MGFGMIEFDFKRHFRTAMHCKALALGGTGDLFVGGLHQLALDGSNCFCKYGYVSKRMKKIGNDKMFSREGEGLGQDL
jgi:hypothetical protein